MAILINKTIKKSIEEDWADCSVCEIMYIIVKNSRLYIESYKSFKGLADSRKRSPLIIKLLIKTITYLSLISSIKFGEESVINISSFRWNIKYEKAAVMLVFLSIQARTYATLYNGVGCAVYYMFVVHTACCLIVHYTTQTHTHTHTHRREY